MSIIATTLQEAIGAAGEYRAGGTDVQARLRLGISQGPITDISRLAGMDQIEVSASGARIGALVTLTTISQHPEIQRFYPGLAIAAGALATPQVRHSATLGGSLLQRTRCPYYRNPAMDCLKRGGSTCPARAGEHSMGVCFDLGPCVFPHPSTLGMVLMAYQAGFSLNGEEKVVPVSDLFGPGTSGDKDNLLQPGQVIRSISLGAPLKGEMAGYFRTIARARAEWPIVEVIARFSVVDGRIAEAHVGIGGVAPVPMLLPQVAKALIGLEPEEAVFMDAAALATQGAKPLLQTAYKVDIIPGTVYETLLRAWKGITHGEG